VRIAEVLDVPGPRDRGLQRLLGVDDDVADAAHAHRRVARAQSFRTDLTGAGDENLGALHLSCDPRVERTGSFDAQRRRAQVVDRELRAPGGADSQCRHLDLLRLHVHRAAQANAIERRKAHGDAWRRGMSTTQEAEAGSPRFGPHDETAVLDARLHARVLSRFDVDRRRRRLHERHARVATHVEGVKRGQIPVLQAGWGGVGGEAAR